MKGNWENFTQLQKTLLLPSNFETTATIENSMKLKTQLAKVVTYASGQLVKDADVAVTKC